MGSPSEREEGFGAPEGRMYFRPSVKQSAGKIGKWEAMQIAPEKKRNRLHHLTEGKKRRRGRRRIRNKMGRIKRPEHVDRLEDDVYMCPGERGKAREEKTTKGMLWGAKMAVHPGGKKTQLAALESTEEKGGSDDSWYPRKKKKKGKNSSSYQTNQSRGGNAR